MLSIDSVATALVSSDNITKPTYIQKVDLWDCCTEQYTSTRVSVAEINVIHYLRFLYCTVLYTTLRLELFSCRWLLTLLSR